VPPDAQPEPHVKAICVGQAKSGTATLWGMLRTHHAAAHEPERPQLLDAILRASRGELTQTQLRDMLVDRDRRLRLDYDIGWQNQFVIDASMAAFPDAKFIVLVRDPYSWVGSIVGHLLSREIPPEVRDFFDLWFRPDLHPPIPADQPLIDRGLYPVAGFLHAWKRHVTTCAEQVPEPRRLVIRTHELDRETQRLADFLDIPIASIDTTSGRLNTNTWSGNPTDLIDPNHLHETIQRDCPQQLARHFPEVSTPDEAAALWR